MKQKKIALLTGDTSGVGLSIARALVEQNYFVIFIGSNCTKGKELELEFNRNILQRAAFFCLDLSKLKDVYSFVNDFKKRYDHLDLLINAAGVVLPNKEITADGFEKTFAIGFLSPFVLSLGLLSHLKKSNGARIVNVSAPANAVLKQKINFKDLIFRESYNGFKASLIAVHAKTVLTEILAEKFQQFKIDVNSFHPGMVRSNLTRNLSVLFRIISKVISPMMSATSANGIFVSSSPQINGASGNLFVNKKPIPLNFDNAYKNTLWLNTIEMLAKFKFDIYENS